MRRLLGKCTVIDRRGDVLGTQIMSTLGESRQQDLVRDDIDASQQPLGMLLNFPGQVVADQFRAGITHLAHTKVQIIVDLFLSQRFQIKIMRNALAQLAYRSHRQVLIQRESASRKQEQWFQ